MAVTIRPPSGATVSAAFILQGLTPQNHVSAIAELTEVERIERILISVAFVSSAGVELVADHLRPHVTKTTVYAGVRNGITSAQAIKSLLELGVDLKTVDTGSAHLVFHPKLYYVRGERTARLLVGSANLTTGGMNNNVEASVVLDLDMSSSKDNKLARSIEMQFDGLTTQYPANVSVVSRGNSLKALLADPRLVDERSTPARAVSRLIGGSGALNPVPLLKMLTTRIISRFPKKRSSPGRASITPAHKATLAPPLAASYELLWTTTGLTERDLNIPKGKSTNAAGSINLDKGAMEDGFEFQSYFRNEVFDQLAWDPPDARKIEKAQAHFHLIVEGIDCGDFVLTVRNDTKTGTKSDAQGQPHTRISWGEAKPYVAKPALIGRTMRLSRAEGEPTKFLIEID
jgi:HKD family nuclease